VIGSCLVVDGSRKLNSVRTVVRMTIRETKRKGRIQNHERIYQIQGSQSEQGHRVGRGVKTCTTTCNASIPVPYIRKFIRDKTRTNRCGSRQNRNNTQHTTIHPSHAQQTARQESEVPKHRSDRQVPRCAVHDQHTENQDELKRRAR